MVDYHLHTPLCHHALGSPSEYLEIARQTGLCEIGFADHYPLGLLGIKPQSEVSMSPDELAGYIREIRALGANEKEIKVKLGVEVDYVPGKKKELAQLLARDPFDFVIGSIHFMEDWDFTHPLYTSRYETDSLLEIYRCYFNLLWQACASGLFDIIGHVDVIKKFDYRLPESVMESYWRQTARVLKENGLCFELNTSGKAAPVCEFYPGRRLLELCFQEGVPVTLGSDAHGPEQVGRYFDDAIRLLKEIGYRELAVFSKRQRSFIPLE
ncbi:MAG: histidinol-phosphatase HisJ family protein [Dethiobacteria bacterium]